MRKKQLGGWAGRRLGKGFTLIEVVVVLTLLGIMAAVVVPAVRELSARSPSAEAAEPVLALIRSTRSAALSRAGRVTLRLDPSRATYRVESDSDGTTIILQQGTLPLPTGATLTGDQPRLVLNFHRDGTANGDSIAVVTRDDAVMISVNRWSGEPHVH